MKPEQTLLIIQKYLSSMTSEKQILANRKNSKYGGVKSEEGKEISCKNSLKHGIFSSELIINDENIKELNILRDGIWDYYKPNGAIEEVLVDRVVIITWRLKRSIRAEKTYLNLEMSMDYSIRADIGEALTKNLSNKNRLSAHNRYEVSLERSLFRTMHELEHLQERRKGIIANSMEMIDVTTE